MIKTEWTITSQWDGYTREDMLFTYNEQDKQEIAFNKFIKEQEENSYSYFIIKEEQLCMWMTEAESILFNFIDGYTQANRWFRYSTQQIMKKLHRWKNKVVDTIKKLQEVWFISKDIKKDRYWQWIRLLKTTSKYQECLNYYRDTMKCLWGGLKIKQPLFENQTTVVWKTNTSNIYSNIWSNINSSSNEEEDIYIPEEGNESVKNFLAVPGEKKEKSSAKKERKEITLALPTEEYKFVDDFIDINNWQIRYQLKTNPDYFKKQYSAVDKLVSMWFSLTDIQTVLNYVKQDDFWSKNILSVEKLLRKNKEWVPYVIVMAEAIKNYRPKAIDLDALAKAKWLL